MGKPDALVKVQMDGERQRYTVMAHDDRHVIMTKPFNAQKTYIYSIADLERAERGPCDLIFGPPSKLDTEEGAREALAMLQAGEMSVSRRRYKPLSADEKQRIAAAIRKGSDCCGTLD